MYIEITVENRPIVYVNITYRQLINSHTRLKYTVYHLHLVLPMMSM